MRFENRKIRRTIVFVIDGLRPDQISMENTPCLYDLMKKSIRFANSRAVFPTVTRVSAAAMGTGVYPGKNGIFGNSIYEPEIDKYQAVNTGTMENIERLIKVRPNGIVHVKTLAERFAEHSLKYAAVSSGTPGSSFLLNPVAANNCVLINGYFKRNERVAFPENVNREIQNRYPAPEDETRPEQTFGNRVSWTEDILRDYVLEELDSDIIVNWIAEPDHSQHYYDVGSPQVTEMIRIVDQKVKEVVNRITEKGEFEETNFFILSDHGYSKCSHAINLEERLITDGLKAGSESEDTIIVDNEEIAFIHVKDRNHEKVREIVEYLQQQKWTDVIFTAPKDQGEQGIIKGTFSLDFINLWNEKSGPDIVVTFPWSSGKNEYGYPGLDYDVGNFTGKIEGARSSHGSLSPYVMRNVMFALGPGFKRDVTSYIPVNILDLAATILHIYGLETKDGLDGRVIDEIFSHNAAVEKIPVSILTHYAENIAFNYKAILQMYYAEGKKYLDKGWRL